MIHRVCTKLEPDREYEVTDSERLDLERMGLLLDSRAKRQARESEDR
ncbi:MAG TPA: hypothetical protein VFU47_12915 [Armatimonadota bacterium]|nr:hypothetical protein [Armatimonadota bacterium]